MIEFKNVKKTYEDGTEALADFSLKINEGELVTLIGPSGCGKTTTMKMINRLIEPTEGTIYINDREIKTYNIHELRWNIGYVLQEIALFPHLSIAENIAVVPEMKKWKRAEIRKRTQELLSMVGLDPDTYSKRMPSELSGGEQQRIGVIRALAADPDIILMDEPFSALDPISREQLQSDIKTLQKEIRKTVVFVTHDMDEASALGDKVCLMKNGEIIQYDTPQNLILNPKNQFVEQFIGDKKSPWQTAVDVIANQNSEWIVTENKWKQNKGEVKDITILKDENENYISMLKKGAKYQGDVLPNDMSLHRATEILKESDQHIFPVLKNEKLVGVLTYRDIVVYLQDRTDIETGVVHR